MPIQNRDEAVAACKVLLTPQEQGQFVANLGALDDSVWSCEYMHDNDDPQAILSYLQSKISGGGGGGGGGGRFTAVEAPPHMQKFWQEVDKAQPVNSFIELPDKVYWLGHKEFGSSLYVRDCYPKLYNIMLDKFTRPENPVKGAGVIGTPGIGKTFLGGYILRERKILRKPVVYHRHAGPLFLFGFDGLGTPKVWAAADAFTFREALWNETTLYIADGVEPWESANAHVILITSPNPEVHKKYCASQHPALCMDIWTREEMDALKCKHPRLSEADYLRLLQQYGNIPRWVLEQTISIDKVQWDGPMTRAITSKDSVSALLSVSQLSTNDRTISHTVVHMRAGPDFLTYHYEIASPWVVDQLVGNALDKGMASFFTLMNSIAKVPGWEHVFGELFQMYAIRMFERGGEFDCRHIPGTKKVQLPAMAWVSRSLLKIPTTASSEFEKLEPDTLKECGTLYYQKMGVAAKLPAADAILTPPMPGEPAFLIQITGGHQKKALSAVGVKSVQSSLTSFLKTMRDKENPETAAGWKDQQSIKLVIVYIVPDSQYLAFTADPTPDPSEEPLLLPRMAVKFPVVMAGILPGLEQVIAPMDSLVGPGKRKMPDAGLLDRGDKSEGGEAEH